MSSSLESRKVSRKPSRVGITLFDRDSSELDGKVTGPVSLLVAQWEGLKLLWDYEQPGDVLVLHATYGGDLDFPVLRIPLNEAEVAVMRGYREKGGWGYYDLNVEENDDRAAVNVSFMDARNEPVSLLWILDKKRRRMVRRAIDRYVGLGDPVFGD